MQHPYEPFDQRLASVEVGTARLEGRVDQGFADMRDRFNSIERRFDSLDQKIDRYFLWMLGLLVVSILLPMASRFTGR